MKAAHKVRASTAAAALVPGCPVIPFAVEAAQLIEEGHQADLAESAMADDDPMEMRARDRTVALHARLQDLYVHASYRRAASSMGALFHLAIAASIVDGGFQGGDRQAEDKAVAARCVASAAAVLTRDAAGPLADAIADHFLSPDPFELVQIDHDKAA